MNTQGTMIVFGSLAAAVAMIVAGAMVSGPLGYVLLSIGILGGIGWVVFALWLASEMSSDI